MRLSVCPHIGQGRVSRVFFRGIFFFRLFLTFAESQGRGTSGKVYHLSGAHSELQTASLAGPTTPKWCQMGTFGPFGACIYLVFLVFFLQRLPKDTGKKKSRKGCGNHLGTHRGTPNGPSVHLLSKSDGFGNFSRTPPDTPFWGLPRCLKWSGR